MGEVFLEGEIPCYVLTKSYVVRLSLVDELVRDIPVYLVSSQSVTWLLGPGQHTIRHTASHLLHLRKVFGLKNCFQVLVGSGSKLDKY